MMVSWSGGRMERRCDSTMGIREDRPVVYHAILLCAARRVFLKLVRNFLRLHSFLQKMFRSSNQCADSNTQGLEFELLQSKIIQEIQGLWPFPEYRSIFAPVEIAFLVRLPQHRPIRYRPLSLRQLVGRLVGQPARLPVSPCSRILNDIVSAASAPDRSSSNVKAIRT